MPAIRLKRAAPVVVAASLLLAATGSPAADRSSAADSDARPAGPLVTDGVGLSTPGSRLLTGRSAFTAPGQHGASSQHLPAVRENVELVSKLEMSTPPAFRTPGTANEPVLPGQIADLAVYKNYAYLNSWSEPTCRRGGIFVVDISDPAAPQQVAFLPAVPNTRHGEGAHVITIDTPAFRGDVLAVNNEPMPSPCPQGVPSAGGFDLWNVTDPRNPRPLAINVGDTGPDDGSLVGADPVHQSHSTFMWQDDDTGRAYVVFTDNLELHDVDIFEITDPANPRPVAEFFLAERFPEVVDSSAFGDLIYHHDVVVKEIGGVQTMLIDYWDAGYVTLNVENPANPQYIGDTSYEGPDPLFPDMAPPEGNAHQAEFSHDNRWILAADEDFSPTRARVNVVGGDSFNGAEATDTQRRIDDLPDGRLNPDTTFVGRGCTLTGGDTMPAAPPDDGDPTTEEIAVIVRGVCTFEEKVNAAKGAGWDGWIIYNNADRPDGDPLVTNGVVVSGGDLPGVFMRRQDALPGIFGITDDSDPAVGTAGSDVIVNTEFDGWGYTHLYENGAGEMRRVDSFAIEEARDPRYSSGFGDLSVHEFATDPTENVAYSSYYSGGMRVFTFGPGGLTQTGKFIDEGGNNFWGVEQFTLSNQRYFAGSDRDFGLYIFRYTGPGAAQRPVCADQNVTVPYQTAVTLTLSCTDANGNPLTLAIGSNPANGSLGQIDQGADTVTYTPNAGFSGSDSFTFTANDGTLTSAPATVRITVGPNPIGCRNAIDGTDRRDDIVGTEISDRIRAGRGDDVVDARAGDDCLFGQGDNDIIDAMGGNDQVSGGGGRDKILGNAGADRLGGGAGMDRLFGAGGNDRLTGGARRDYLTAGGRNDTLIGGGGRDSLVGDRGNDRMSGGRGNDILRGNQGSDRITGGRGRDLVVAGRGRDRVRVADGRVDHVSCGSGRDRATADRIDRLTNCERVTRR